MALTAIDNPLVTMVSLIFRRILSFFILAASLFSSQESEFFTHETLEDPASQIWLLFLEPSLDIGDPIVCTLKTVPCIEVPP